MPTFVTIATFTFPHEVMFIRGRLESEGIQCFVKDELTIQAHNFYSNALGGVKLQVWDTQLDKAIEVLKECDISAGVAKGFKDVKVDKICPNCGSNEIEIKNLPIFAWLSIVFIIGFPLLFFKRDYICNECGLEFKNGTKK